MFRTSRLVHFHETDAAGIIHFSAFFTYMEEAEHALLRSRGLSVLTDSDDGRISWPRVAANCEFQSPVRFEDELDVAVTVERIGTRSITYRFDFTHQGRAVASGKMTSVCCRIREGAPPVSIPIPAEFVQRLS